MAPCRRGDGLHSPSGRGRQDCGAKRTVLIFNKAAHGGDRSWNIVSISDRFRLLTNLTTRNDDHL